MELLRVAFGIMVGLLVIALLGATGVIKKSPFDFPYVVILPVGVVTSLVLFGFGFYNLFVTVQ